jgi:hypothetical protein
MEFLVSVRQNRRFYPLYWAGIACILLVADYFAGPFIQFPVTYLIPIALASWYSGLRWGLLFACAMPLVRLFFNIELWTIPWTIFDSGINCGIRMIVFSLFVVLIARTARQTRALAKEVSMMSGLLPICSYCKKIRDDSNTWQPIEQYIVNRSNASFTHGLCPECVEKHYGEYLKK